MSSNDIVPEDFDLDAARKARSTTPEDERKRCPECESVNVSPCHSSQFQGRESTARYYCNTCRTNFDDPIRGIRG